MFGGVPVLTPAHLAKWLVLREQWPALARAVAREPEVLGELERGAGKRDPELVELLDSGPPLGAVIERLIYFQPAENGRTAGLGPSLLSRPWPTSPRRRAYRATFPTARRPASGWRR